MNKKAFWKAVFEWAQLVALTAFSLLLLWAVLGALIRYYR